MVSWWVDVAAVLDVKCMFNKSVIFDLSESRKYILLDDYDFWSYI